MTDGWRQSAQAWIDSLGEDGDFSRRAVLDGPMLARLSGRGFTSALDLGCGEGRFCRLSRRVGVDLVGLDPTPELLSRARSLDPEGRYVQGCAERLPFGPERFDLVVSYLTFIDIPDLRRAVGEVVRVLRPGGTFLIANLQSFATASEPPHWVRDAAGNRLHFRVDTYFDERASWAQWNGIRILNHHRAMSTYMQTLLAAGLALVHWDEPRATGPEVEQCAIYNRVPYLYIMEWQKPA